MALELARLINCNVADSDREKIDSLLEEYSVAKVTNQTQIQKFVIAGHPTRMTILMTEGTTSTMPWKWLPSLRT